MVSSYGLFADPSTVQDNLRSLAVMLPADAFGVVQDQVGRVLAKGASTLGWTFIFGFAVALWSANAGTKAIIDALNVVYEEREKRSFLKLNAISIILTLAALITVVLAISAVIVIPLLLQRLNLGDASKTLVSIGRWPALAILLLSALAVLYRYGPSRSKWQWISVGALAAVILWLGGSATLSWYLSRFGNYTATYGSLGAAIGLMTWMWMSAIVILFGAELNSEIEHQTAIDSTDGTQRPLGERGAVMADTLGQIT
jgi:membrane protein